MKKQILLLAVAIVLFCFQTANAQGVKEREVGIYTSNFFSSTYGLQYKSSMNSDWYWTVNAFNADGRCFTQSYSTPNSFPMSQTDLNLNLAFGLEKHMALTEKLVFFAGPQLVASGGVFIRENEDPEVPLDLRKLYNESYSVGLGVSIGMKFKITENLHAGTFFMPSIMYGYSESESLSWDYEAGERVYKKNYTYSSSVFGNFSFNQVMLSLYFHW